MSWEYASTWVSKFSSHSSRGSALSIGSSIYDGTGEVKSKKGGRGGGWLRWFSIKSAAKAELTVADRTRKLKDVYDVDGGVINSTAAVGVVHKCRHKASKTTLLVRTINKPGTEGRKKPEPPKKGAKKPKGEDRPWESTVTEITIMKQMRHDNIVLVYDIFEDSRYVHVVTEKLDGMGIFAQIVSSESAYTEREASLILQQAAKGLEYMHSCFIVHRDIKPASFQFSRITNGIENNPLKIVDFSSACYCKQNQVLRQQVGTPYYYAPEVLHGRYGTQCDMWSLGVLAYILLCGWVPFRGDTDVEIKEKIKVANYIFAPMDWKHVSKDAKDVVRMALEVDPKKRYTPTEFLADPWVQELGGGKINILATGNNPDLVARLKNFSTKTVNGDARPTLLKPRVSTAVAIHVIAEELPEEKVSELRELFGKVQGEISVKEMRSSLKVVGLKEFPLDPVKVAQEADVEDQVEFAPTSEIEWESNDGVFTAFRNTEGGIVLPGRLLRVSPEDGNEAAVVNPLTIQIVAWVDGSKTEQKELRELIALLRGNSFF